ncbi:hypothetical protein OG339_47730 (plasmid) [Streptosporangium sp. NBC_01495]|uniref:hypothetical protein n=1 Tax=Streptosporangium sp. NBC_01495 TaxID=2903899 RepID=UPI002E2FABED|nr:hypothetical protein [Streptosporangium sp. NBC_01495]
MRSTGPGFDSLPFLAGPREASAPTGLSMTGWPGQEERGAGSAPLLRPDGDLADLLDTMRRLRTILACQDNMLGSGAVIPSAIQQVSILRELSRTATGTTRHAVMDLQAAYAEFAGWLNDDLGHRGAGQQWINNALLWAHEADNELLIAYILLRQSQRAAETGDTAAAVALAQAAQRRGELTARMRAAAAQAEAGGHALSGDERGFTTTVALARDLAAQAPPPTAGEWASWCTPAYIAAHEARGWAHLGRHDRAVESYQHALRGWPAEFHRDRGLYLSRLAHSQALTGAPEQATHTARTALAIACGTRSARILAELAPVRKALTPWRDNPRVSEFTDELTHVTLGTENGPPCA